MLWKIKNKWLRMLAAWIILLVGGIPYVLFVTVLSLILAGRCFVLSWKDMGCDPKIIDPLFTAMFGKQYE